MNNRKKSLDVALVAWCGRVGVKFVIKKKDNAQGIPQLQIRLHSARPSETGD